MTRTGDWRIGIDIGGTFTDGVLIDEATGRKWIDKIPTTPADPSLGFATLVDSLCGKAAIDPADLSLVVHATTTTTNTLLERNGASVALFATDGFRDVLEIQRQIRHDLYNLQMEKPEPLVPRHRCFAIPERLDHTGRVLKELDEAAVAAAAAAAAATGATSVAICFLHSYVNPAHEIQAAEIVRREQPSLAVSVSSEIAPEIREYWRASSAVVNAYVAPIVSTYLDRISTRLAERGATAPLYVMGSNGGVMTADTARRMPVCTVESGPAAGVAAALDAANRLSMPNSLTFDMGGTTAKVGIIVDGRVRVLREFEVGCAARLR